MVILQGRTYHKLDSKEIKVQHKNEQVCVEWKAIKWSMIKQIIEGKDGISHPEFDRYLGRAQNVDDVHDTFVARIYEAVIDRR